MRTHGTNRVAGITRMVALLSIVLLSGCTYRTPKTWWEKPGWSEEELRRDGFDCRNAAITHEQARLGLFNFMTWSAKHQEFFEECMTTHGWTMTKKEER